MATKLNIENLMPGSEAWWHQQSAVNHPERAVAPTTAQAPDDVKRQQLADMRQPNPMMPTRTRGGGYRQPGIGDGELNEFQQQSQEPNQAIKNFNEYGEKAKEQAQKIAERRADGVLPEQATAVDRHQRTAVDAAKGNPDNVNALQEELGLTDGGTATARGTNPATPAYNSYDDILKLMRHNAVSDAELARRQRSREIVTGLGDMINSITNMWATTKGAPNSYDNSKGMSATAQERYAKMLAERKAQHDQILNYYRVKRQAEQEKENQEYRNSMLEIRRQEAERRQKQADEERARKDAITKSRVERDEAAKTAAENKTLEAMGKSHLATRYNYYLEVEGRDPEEARKRAIRDADAWLEEQRNLDNNKTKSQTQRNNRSNTGSSKRKKGKQAKKKVAPKRKVRQNASSQSQSSGGNTMPGVK